MAVAYFKGNIGEVWYIVGIKDVLLWARKVDVKQLYGTSVHLWNGSREHATIWLESLAATVACLKHLCDMYTFFIK